MLESAQMLTQLDLDSFKTSIDSWGNVAILIRSNANVDKLAGGLSLYLALKKLGKKVSIATDTNLTVARTNLFGLGEVENILPQQKGGDMTLTLEGVVIDQGPDAGKVPALEKLDWYPEGKDLKLKFSVLPGQRFEPSNVRVDYEDGGFDALIVVGCVSLADLGSIYTSNQGLFEQTTVVNIDSQPQNSKFGKINLVDSESFSVSEVASQVLENLGVALDGDLASNILSGVYMATNNLTRGVGANTFLAVGRAMQAGGKVPTQPSRPSTPSSAQVQAPRPQTQQAQPRPATQQPVQQSVKQSVPQPSVQQQTQVTPEVIQTKPSPAVNPFLATGGGSFNPVFSPTFSDESNQAQEGQTTAQSPSGGFDLGGFKQQQQQTSPGTVPTEVPEEPPVGAMGGSVSEGDVEVSGEFNPAPDWLTPKVYKGGGD